MQPLIRKVRAFLIALYFLTNQVIVKQNGEQRGLICKMIYVRLLAFQCGAHGLLSAVVTLNIDKLIKPLLINLDRKAS